MNDKTMNLQQGKLLDPKADVVFKKLIYFLPSLSKDQPRVMTSMS